MKRNKRISLTIGISAYNEEANIKNLLTSALNQELNNAFVKEIIVISDGSNDNTVKICHSFNDKTITVIKHNQREGKAKRINEIISRFKGEILVILDADMFLYDKKSISKLIQPLLHNVNTQLSCGHAIPIKGLTLLERSINNFRYSRDELMSYFNFGKTAFAAHGYIALSKKLANQITLPKLILNDDAYCYFYALTKGYNISFVKDAIVNIRSPQKIKDYLNQSTRHYAGEYQLYKYFGKECVQKGYTVPKSFLIRLLVKQLIKNPIGYIYLKILNVYSKYMSNHASNNLNKIWREINTTKVVFN